MGEVVRPIPDRVKPKAYNINKSSPMCTTFRIVHSLQIITNFMWFMLHHFLWVLLLCKIIFTHTEKAMLV